MFDNVSLDRLSTEFSKMTGLYVCTLPGLPLAFCVVHAIVAEYI